MTRQATAFTKEIAPALQEAGVAFTAWHDLDADAQAQLTRVFEDRIFPVLTPLAVDPAHPFPYISNLSLNLAVVVRDRASGEERFARVKVPPLLPRFVSVPDSARYVPLEQVIAAHLDALFPGMEVLAQYPFRVTRDADIELSDESEDLLAAMEIVAAATHEVRSRGPARGRHEHHARGARAAVPRARARRRTTCTRSTRRSTSAGCGTSTACAGPS